MPHDKLRVRSHGLLWFGTDADQRDRWSITDPESERLAEACRRLRPIGPSENGGQWPERTPEEKQRDSDIYVLLRAVYDYRHLTTYELGVEHILKKLRVIWRALRTAAEPETTEPTHAPDADWAKAVAEHLPTFKRRGFDGNGIDFTGVKPEAIKAMADALVELEQSEKDDDAWLSAGGQHGQHVCTICLADLPDFGSNLCATCLAKGVR